MIITKIKIQNFKSIRDIEFDVKKYGNSYTTMLVGINESGKSNILEAMSYFNPPNNFVDYNLFHNQKIEEDRDVHLCFEMELENKQTIANIINPEIINGDLLKFEISKITKNIYLNKKKEGLSKFLYYYSYEINKLPKNIFIKSVDEEDINEPLGTETLYKIEISKDKHDDEFVELTEDSLTDYLGIAIDQIIGSIEPNVVLWRPSDKHLLNAVNLNNFKKNINSNIPLRNIFYIAKYRNAEAITSKIESINNNMLRLRLASVLGKAVTKYITDIWHHEISINIEITKRRECTVSVRDKGKANEHDNHEMFSRSDGFKQFISLILSLSAEIKFAERTNNLILIDEPEAHLHPSGIRDLRDELLAMGENNFLFVSTHSPFLIDGKNKKRNIIVTKNKAAETEKIEIDSSTDIKSDEVLTKAFGMDTFDFLLHPHYILAEGKSDQKIIQSALMMKDYYDYGVKNGGGSKVASNVTKVDGTGMSILVLLDADDIGMKLKTKIVKNNDLYLKDYVFTIRDLVSSMPEGSTIEDCLGKEYFKLKFSELYKQYFNKTECSFNMETSDVALLQARKHLQSKKVNEREIKKFINELKIKVSDDFSPSKSSFIENFPLLNELVESIHEKLSNK